MFFPLCYLTDGYRKTIVTWVSRNVVTSVGRRNAMMIEQFFKKFRLFPTIVRNMREGVRGQEVADYEEAAFVFLKIISVNFHA